MNEPKWKQVSAAECKAWALAHPMAEYHIYELSMTTPTLARFNPAITIGEQFSDSPHCFEFFDVRDEEWSWDDSPFYAGDTYFIPEVTE